MRFHEQFMLTAAKTIKITDLNTEQVVRKIENDKTKIYSLLVADDYLLVYGDDRGRFRVYDYRIENGGGAYFESHDCDQFISDLDIDDDRRTVVATSGEGTLTAYNIRAKRMQFPQSELFDTGFTSVRLLQTKSKAVVATEDGVLNIFNKGEWGNISDRFPIQQNNTGFSSIENLEVLDDENNIIIFGTSQGSLTAASLFPHANLGDLETGGSAGIEALDVNQITKRIVCVAENEVRYFSYDLNHLPPGTKRVKTNDFFQGLES